MGWTLVSWQSMGCSLYCPCQVSVDSWVRGGYSALVKLAQSPGLTGHFLLKDSSALAAVPGSAQAVCGLACRAHKGLEPVTTGGPGLVEDSS